MQAVIYPEFGSVAKVTIYVDPDCIVLAGNVTAAVDAACVAPAAKSVPPIVNVICSVGSSIFALL